MAGEQAAGAPRMRQRCFVEALPDATIHYQVIDLGRQLYVWASMGSAAKLGSLCMAIQTPAVRRWLPQHRPHCRRP